VKDAILRFPCGRWHFRPENAFEKHYYISNNDHGLKKIAFPIIGFSGLTIDGGNSEFIFHGRVLPFMVENSCWIKLQNITLDVERPFYTQGRITATGSDWVELNIDRKAFPYDVLDGKIIFHSEGWRSEKDIFLLTEFDPVKKEPALRKRHTQVRSEELFAEAVAPDCVRLKGKFPIPFTPGNVLIIIHEKRHVPSIVVSQSQSITVEDVSIHQSGAMGLIAQLSRDITVRRMQVRLREGSDRLVSVNADATHFVNCTGWIRMEDCVFDNMMDDGTNVHGIYTVVTGIPTEHQVEVCFMHHQQEGISLYAAGDRLRFVDRTTLLSRATATISQVETVDQRCTRLTFEELVEDIVKEGDAVECFEKMPDITIQRCRTGNNRPRGFLLTTPGHVLVEDCEFHNSHHGIHISGDANYWYESGPVRDVTIRRCHFRDCGYGFGGTPICIQPGIRRPEDNPECYHRNIRIEENVFDCFAPGLVTATSVDGLQFKRNRWSRTDHYPAGEENRPDVACFACKNVEKDVSDEPVA